MNHQEKGITLIGLNYLDSLIFDHLKESYDVYKKKGFTKKQFQVSIHENKHATAGIVLTAIGIEAYRNSIYFIDGLKIHRSVPNDLHAILYKKDENIPLDLLHNGLLEIFILRDIIVHSHVYKVSLRYDKDWNLMSQRHQILKDQYGDKKLLLHSSSRSKKSNQFKLNIQPIRIGFEDYFKILIILDLLINIIDKYWNGKIIQYHPLFQLDGYWFPDLSELYSYFYEIIPNKSYKNSFRKLLTDIRKLYLPYVDSSKSFIGNVCPTCGEFGFSKARDIHKCNKCNCEIKTLPTF